MKSQFVPFVLLLAAVTLAPGCGGDAEPKNEAGSSSSENDGADSKSDDSAETKSQTSSSKAAGKTEVTGADAELFKETTSDSLVEVSRRDTDKGLDAYFPALSKRPAANSVGVETKEERYNNPGRSLKARWQVKKFSDGTDDFHGKYTEFWPNGQMNIEGAYRNGLREGKWVYTYENGKPCRTVNYSKGKLDGEWDILRPDGTRKATVSYKGGKKDGKHQGYDKKGKRVLVEREFKDNMLNGKTAFFFESGDKRLDETYVAGKRQGLRTVWYENGREKETANFKDGKRHGQYVAYGEDGTKRVELEFEDDKQVGENLVEASDIPEKSGIDKLIGDTEGS